MKNISRLLLSAICLFYFFEQVCAQQKTMSIRIDTSEGQLAFAAREIVAAARVAGYSIRQMPLNNNDSNAELQVRVIADSSMALDASRSARLALPASLSWQAYSIRVQKYDSRVVIHVLAADATGGLYGTLDIAEAIRNNTIATQQNSDSKPYLERRGIKFNIPLDLRTPSYSDMSDAGQQNIPVIWEMNFWKKQLDEMARNRYNVLSLWSLHPFPSIVKVPEFPDVALNDVWRTRAPIHDHYSLNGDGYVSPELLANHEVVKKMTIDEKITFWKNVMAYAKSLGIEIYWFTWNIFTYGAEGKYGITDRQDNDTTIRYFRATVREMVLTYPDLAGVGITAGEHMEAAKSRYGNEEWLWKTYGLGIDDALKKQPARNFRLIHRFHQTNLQEIQHAFSGYRGTFDLSLKYAIAHMYGIPNPSFVKPAMNLFSSRLKTWLTLRNDDIYSFRWGNPSFARQFILSIPEPEKVAGFYMGPDGYTWGMDFLDRDLRASQVPIIQKQWYSFMLWGRLGYDPTIPDAVFNQTLQSRFPGVPVQALARSWSAASMIFPWITRLAWGDVDFKWLPEACISRQSYKGFYTVRDFMEVDPEAGSNIRNMIQWAQLVKPGFADSMLSPAAVADTLDRYITIASENLKLLPPRKPGTFDEYNRTLGDIEAFAAIGQYYAEKIRGAASLAQYNFSGLKKDQENAIKYLTSAKEHWKKYAAVYSSQYKPALYNRIGFVDVNKLVRKTDDDIAIARSWKPGTIKEYRQKTQTEVPFRK